MKKVVKWILSTVTALFVAIAFIGAGLAVCAIPDMTTRVVSENTSDFSTSSFDKDKLVAAAIATKQYTVNVHDREQLDDLIRDINEGRNVSKLDERFKLTEDAIGHLDDVHAVLVQAGIVIGCIAIVALLLSVLCGLWKGMILVGDMLIEAGIITIVLMIACIIFAAINFNALFESMHSLFFEEGTWTFSADSLLITMYPQSFWIVMGSIWAAVSGVFAIIAGVFGIVLHCLGKKSQQIPYPFAQPGYDILYY